MNRYLQPAAFVAGLLAVAWVGIGYLGANPLALAVTVLIGAFFVVGALELRRYRQATATLDQALASPAAPDSLAAWLAPLHASLREPVRLRVEGERVALPAPALAPYLAGLLVLLGMLGTFAGMVVTLKGTGLALEGATDLQAVRASLSAPVKGLGLAFGTSLAGVATSAMLGLMSALARRERLQAAQALDARIGSVLRPYSLAHRRDESMRLMREQSEQMPRLVDRLETMLATLERQQQELGNRLADGQARFHHEAQAAYAGLAASVDRSLKESLTESARAAALAIQPVAEATMAGIAREAAGLHGTVARDAAALHQGLVQSVGAQLAGVAERFEAASGVVSGGFAQTLAAQREAGQAQAEALGSTLRRFSEHFEQRADALVDTVATRLDGSLGRLGGDWDAALARQQQQAQALADGTAQALSAQRQAAQAGAEALGDALRRFSEHFEQRAEALVDTVATRLDGSLGRLGGDWDAAIARQQQQAQALSDGTREALDAQRLALQAQAQALGEALDGFGTRFEQRSAALVDGVAQRLDQTVERIAGGWDGALARHQALGDAVATGTRDALAAAAASVTQQADALLRTVDEAHARLQAQMAARDEERLAAWSGAMQSLAGSLREEWHSAGERSAQQQQAVCDALARTAEQIAAQAGSHARETIAEIERLVQAASEAPRAAAEVIAELRQKLSDGMARDNAMLDERARILETLDTLLGAIQHACGEQRGAIDALVSASSEMLERTGGRFGEQVEAQSAQLSGAAAQVAAGAVEVASLGEAFGQAVQVFGQTSERLVDHLQRLEGTLGKSIARSDEQLAYYVAQAREVIDLSILSQKQIVEDMQRLAAPAAHGAQGAAAPVEA